MIRDRLQVNLNREDAWARFSQSLGALGCSEDDMRHAWERISESELGELEVRTRTTPNPPFWSMKRSLNPGLFPGPKLGPEDVVVVWEYKNRFIPGNIVITVHTGPVSEP